MGKMQMDGHLILNSMLTKYFLLYYTVYITNRRSEILNKLDEKLRIYSMMDKITEERSKLTDMYLGLLNRLEVLDESERQEVKEEIKVEDDFLIQESIELVHDKTLDEIIDEHNQKYNEVLEEPVVAHRVPKIEIERELDKLPKRKHTMDLQRASMLVSSVLKEKGIPTSTNELFELVLEKSEVKINEKNFRNNILPRVVKGNNRVERAMRGFYQYK